MSVTEERFDLELLREAERYQRWVLDSFGAALQGDVLEVGAGIGNFTRWLAPRARVVVVEPDPAMCSEISALGLTDVELCQVRLEDYGGAPDSFDAVLLCNVLEHLDDDVAALRTARRLLRPGGHVCVLVPAHPRLYGSLDARYGHLRRYRKAEVRRVMEEAEFADVEARYFNPLGALGWFIVARAARRPRLNPSAVRTSERIAVPVGRVLERLSPPPLGQSVLATGRRP